MEQPPSSSGGVIAVVGGATMDMIYEVERMPEREVSLDALSLAYKPGGKGSNTAIAIYRGQHDNPRPADDDDAAASSNLKNDDTEDEHGKVEVYLNTAVGNDTFSQKLLDDLEENGVDTSNVEPLNGDVTGACTVFVETSTGSSRNIGFPGANMSWYPGINVNWNPMYPISINLLSNGKQPDLLICHLENERGTVQRLLATAARSGVDTLLNPSPAYDLPDSIYEHVTHLVMNEAEAAELTGTPSGFDISLVDVCGHFIDRTVKNVVITLGARGAFFGTPETYGRVEAVKDVDVKDTTGAGDTFVGNYALEYVRQKRSGEAWDIKKAVERGCKAAAKTIEQLGAQESIPWADEIGITNLRDD